MENIVYCLKEKVVQVEKSMSRSREVGEHNVSHMPRKIVHGMLGSCLKYDQKGGRGTSGRQCNMGLKDSPVMESL